MELSDAGQKVWDRPFHPLYANNLGDGTTFVGEPGVPFGWVVAKDCLQGLLAQPDDEMWQHKDGGIFTSEEIINHLTGRSKDYAIALCNAIAEEGL